MKLKNICKFVTSDINSQLVPTSFVLESNPETMKQPASNPLYRMVLITGQTGKYKLNNRYYSCTVGDIIIFFENEVYFFEGDVNFQYIYIDFKGLRAEELFKRFGINRLNRAFSGFDGLVPMWQECLSRASEVNIDLAAESILLYTFSRFHTKASKKDNFINRIIEITEEDFSDSQLSIRHISEQLGYNSKYLSHVFKEKMGIGYTEYLQTFRIKYAISLFEHGIDSIKNVALLSGFTDPLYFSTVFKSKIGVSPKSYIKKLSDKSEA